MDQNELSIINSALSHAQYLIENEIQCVINEDLYNEYQGVLEDLEYALQVIREHTINQ